MSEHEENSQLNDKGKHPFSLPGDYFISFSKKMMHKIELADEIKEFKTLSSIDKRLPFVTPEGYFVRTLNGAEVTAELGAYPALSALKRTNGFTVPDLYFETAEKAIRQGIELAGELSAYPLLSQFGKTTGFSVPQNYFETASSRVRENIQATAEEAGFGKVLQLVFNRKAAYALAAMLVLSLGLYFFTNESKVIVNDGNCQTLACLDKKDIKENQLLHIDEESLMEVVNPETLSKNLKKNLETSPAETASDKKEKEDYVLENTDVNDIVDGI